ncbi:MAG: DUF3365 domain-containing protein [Bacillota bacterium]|nr:DUF3365 domain-containing protein [Bacillota bacterium]
MKNKSLTYRFMTATIMVVIVIMGVNMMWNYHQQKKQALAEMKEKAIVLNRYIDAVWSFMDINQDRINYDSKGNFEFKRLNCSTVVMGISALFNESIDYRIKETNANPRNELNTPDEFELTVLNMFEENPDMEEFWEVDTVEGEKVFRYMSPMEVTENCLECHGAPVGQYDIAGYPKEGWKLGQLGGAISIIMPMDVFYGNMKKNISFSAIFLIILICVIISAIYLLVSRLVTRSLSSLEKAVAEVGKGNLETDVSDIHAQGEIKELAVHFQYMVEQLRDLYNNMGQKVEQRTIELENANQILQNQRKELEKVNAQMESASKYKSEFYALMSHELKTPLTSIIAFTEMLLTDEFVENGKEEHYLEEIYNNSQILLRLISNIINYAKLEAGYNVIEIEVMDLADVIAAVEGVIEPLARKKDIELNIDISPEVPLIKGDPENLRIIVQNLAGNAIKFTNIGGHVWISVLLDESINELMIKVEDDGIGIKPDKFEYIFDKFTQEDSSISRKYGGTGLGLALSKELVELHGGQITVESTFGKGSCFTVRIPVETIE